MTTAWLAAMCVVLLPASQDERADWPVWVVPDLVDATTAGSPIDLSRLNPDPAGTHGRLRAAGERIVDGRGREVRLFGTNLTDFHPMPPKADAPRIAERLRQFGFNFIRLHYYDWAKAPDGILAPDGERVDAAKLDQLHYLVGQLKRCGIYTDLNLHVARGYAGMPEGWDRMGKGIDHWHAPYVESQRVFARAMLEPVNPYTGLSLAKDPAVAVVELNNENSILDRWPQYAGTPERFSGPLRARWNAWLARKYRTTATLAQTWNPAGSEAVGAEVLSKAAPWQLEVQTGAIAVLSETTGPEGATLEWKVDRPGLADWHVQLLRPSVPFQKGKSYVLRFSAKAEEPIVLNVKIQQQAPPWGIVGMPQAVSLTSRFEDYEVGFTLGEVGTVPVRLNLDLGTRKGNVTLRGMSLREGSTAGLRKGERIEDGTVPLVGDSRHAGRTQDYLQFLLDEEEQNVSALTRYVRRDLGFEGLVWTTQVNYGGLGGLRRAEREGATDIHGYPAHPFYVSTPAGQVWATSNESMLEQAFGGLERMAFHRVPGQPFFVTEFDLNPPNDHAAETFPLLAAMACRQGWAGFNDYAWYNFQRTHGWDRIFSPFATTGHAGQMTTVPMAALMYREGLIPRASTTATLSVPREGLTARLVGSAWHSAAEEWNAVGARPLDAWRLRLGSRTEERLSEPRTEGFTPSTGARYATSDGSLVLDRTTSGEERLEVTQPNLRLILGRIAGKTWRLGDVTVTLESGPRRNSAQFSLVTLDESPLKASKRVLVTSLGRVENRDWVWDAARTRVQPDFGQGPTVAEPVPFRLTLPGDGWRARTLNGHGRPDQTLRVSGSELRVSRAEWRPWILLERD